MFFVFAIINGIKHSLYKHALSRHQ